MRRPWKEGIALLEARDDEGVRLDDRLADVVLWRLALPELRGRGLEVVQSRSDGAGRAGGPNVWQPAQPAALKIWSPVVAWARPADASAPSRRRAGGRIADVGGHVPGVVALDETRGHDAALARVQDLPVHDALDGVATDAVGRARLEGLSRLGPCVPCGAGPGKRVAGAALLHELGLAVVEVGLVAPARREGQRERDGARARTTARPCSG